METQFIIAIVTSLIALISAIVATLFSYFSSKNATKVQAREAYIKFMEIKINRLEEMNKELKIIDHSDFENVEGSHYLGLAIDLFKKCDDYLEDVGYLFTENKDDFNKVYAKCNELSSKISGMKVSLILASALGKKDSKLEELKDFPSLVFEKSLECFKLTKELVRKELGDTFKKFEILSMVK